MTCRTIVLSAAACLALAGPGAAGASGSADALATQKASLTVHHADALAVRGEYTDALAVYQQLLAQDPKSAVLHNKIGICWQKSGNESRARNEYRRAVKLDPAYAEAWNNLGTLEQSRGRSRKAIEAYGKAIALKPGTAVFHRNLAVTHLALGDVAAATAEYSEALRLDPAALAAPATFGVGSPGVSAADQYVLLARVCARQGDPDRALDFLARAREAGFRDFGRLAGDPDFATIARDPRFGAAPPRG